MNRKGLVKSEDQISKNYKPTHTYTQMGFVYNEIFSIFQLTNYKNINPVFGIIECPPDDLAATCRVDETPAPVRESICCKLKYLHYTLQLK